MAELIRPKVKVEDVPEARPESLVRFTCFQGSGRPPKGSIGWEGVNKLSRSALENDFWTPHPPLLSILG